MVISDSLCYAFYDIPKTGTQTMNAVLQEHYDGTLQGHHAFKPLGPEYFRFTVVRNPYARAVSLWASTCLRDGDRYGIKAALCAFGVNPKSFTGFMHWLITEKPRISALGPTQCEMLANTQVDAVLHLETLDEEFKALPFYAGLPSEWPMINSTVDTRRRDYHAYMGLGAASMVRLWAADDFKRFDYALDHDVEESWKVYEG